jgi:hypothetical protein
VQASLSSQVLLVFSWTQPEAGSQESAVQVLLSSQVIAVCAQVPLQLSAVQALLSSQSLSARQPQAYFPEQTPAWQVSSAVQLSVSLQTVPVSGRYPQAPFAHEAELHSTSGQSAAESHSHDLDISWSPEQSFSWSQPHEQVRVCVPFVHEPQSPHSHALSQ